MRESQFLVTGVQYSRMATQNKWSKRGVQTANTYGSDPVFDYFSVSALVNSILVRFLQVRYRSISTNCELSDDVSGSVIGPTRSKERSS